MSLVQNWYIHGQKSRGTVYNAVRACVEMWISQGLIQTTSLHKARSQCHTKSRVRIPQEFVVDTGEMIINTFY